MTESQQHAVGAILICFLMIGISATTGFVVEDNIKASDITFETLEFKAQTSGDVDVVAWHRPFSCTVYSSFGSVWIFNETGSYYITFGGYLNTTANTDKIFRTDVVNNVTEIIGTLPVAIRNAGVCYDGTGNVYIAGGITGAAVNTIYAFNLTNNTAWNTGETLPVATEVSSLGVWVPSTSSCCWIGFNDNGKDKVTYYTPANNTCWVAHTISSFATDVKVTFPGITDEGIIWMFGAITDTKEGKVVGFNPVNNTDWVINTTTPWEEGIYNAIWNGENNSFMLGNCQPASGYSTNISEYLEATQTPIMINSTYPWSGTRYPVGFNNRTGEKKFYVGTGSSNFNITEITWSYTPSGSTASVYQIKGLPANYITFGGTAGTTVYCNSSGDTNEWLEINMTINATDNVTEIRVFMDDFNDTDAWINASNITMYVSSDNSSYGEMGTFTDGGSNLSINSTNWNAGTMGTNSFLGAGLTNKNTSIWCIFKLSIPVDSPTDEFYTFASDSCKIYLGHFV